MDEAQIAEMVTLVTRNFRCFGGGRVTPGNPISQALKDQSAQFAAGVSVEDVVRFVANQIEASTAKNN